MSWGLRWNDWNLEKMMLVITEQIFFCSSILKYWTINHQRFARASPGFMTGWWTNSLLHTVHWSLCVAACQQTCGVHDYTDPQTAQIQSGSAVKRCLNGSFTPFNNGWMSETWQAVMDECVCVCEMWLPDWGIYRSCTGYALPLWCLLLSLNFKR